MKGLVSFFLIGLLLFSPFSCSKLKPKINLINPTKTDVGFISQEKNTKKDPNQITIQTTFQSSQLEKVPEFKIDWSKYPSIDIEKLVKKPLRMDGKIINVEEFLRDKYYLEVVGNYIVSYDNTSAILTCLDMKNWKYLWGIRGYLNNEYGQGQGYIKDKYLICTTDYYRSSLSSVVSLELATAKVKWRFSLPEWNQKTNQRSPYVLNVTEEQVLIRSVNRDDSSNDTEYLLALDSTTGKEIWRSNLQIPYDTDYFLGNNFVIFPCYDGILRAINTINGKTEKFNGLMEVISH
jgi:hypothetical protein